MDVKHVQKKKLLVIAVGNVFSIYVINKYDRSNERYWP